ncbi:uncharacterized protein [Panulirus ornatus]|uniref:uncharacterized protein isoform X3 n=1 Tax=Panulirus ornatus TaxID=150431 RepID=UPI003A85A8C4
MMVVSKTAVLLLIILQDTAGASDALWCYECGTGVEGEPDCTAFARASTWTIFWRKCPKDYICVKTTGWAATDEAGRGVVRGCSPRANLKGVKHQEGCWSHTSTYTVTCFCDRDLCNVAHTPAPSAALPLAALLTLLYIWWPFGDAGGAAASARRRERTRLNNNLSLNTFRWVLVVPQHLQMGVGSPSTPSDGCR